MAALFFFFLPTMFKNQYECSGDFKSNKNIYVHRIERVLIAQKGRQIKKHRTFSKYACR